MPHHPGRRHRVATTLFLTAATACFLAALVTAAAIHFLFVQDLLDWDVFVLLLALDLCFGLLGWQVLSILRSALRRSLGVRPDNHAGASSRSRLAVGEGMHARGLPGREDKRPRWPRRLSEYARLIQIRRGACVLLALPTLAVQLLAASSTARPQPWLGKLEIALPGIAEVELDSGGGVAVLNDFGVQLQSIRVTASLGSGDLRIESAPPSPSRSSAEATARSTLRSPSSPVSCCCT